MIFVLSQVQNKKGPSLRVHGAIIQLQIGFVKVFTTFPGQGRLVYGLRLRETEIYGREGRRQILSENS